MPAVSVTTIYLQYRQHPLAAKATYKLFFANPLLCMCHCYAAAARRAATSVLPPVMPWGTAARRVAVVPSHVVSLSHCRISCCCRAVARRVAVTPLPVMSLSCHRTSCRCRTVARRVPLAPSHIVSLSHRCPSCPSRAVTHRVAVAPSRHVTVAPSHVVSRSAAARCVAVT